jgi:chromosome segregation ATPase
VTLRAELEEKGKLNESLELKIASKVSDIDRLVVVNASQHQALADASDQVTGLITANTILTADLSTASSALAEATIKLAGLNAERELILSEQAVANANVSALRSEIENLKADATTGFEALESITAELERISALKDVKVTQFHFEALKYILFLITAL